MNSVLVDTRPNSQGLGLGFQGLFGGDVVVFFHPLDDVQLPRACTFWVADGVVSRRCLGQAGQHGSFCNGDVFE